MDPCHLDRFLHHCFKYVGDDAVVWMVFAEMQMFKGVKSYFTDSMLYQENNEPVKEPLPDNVDSGNEADSKSEEDAPDTISVEPIVAYLDAVSYTHLTLPTIYSV